MAVTPRIVILDINSLTPGLVTVRAVFWFDQQAGYPLPGFVSAYQNLNVKFPAVLTALQAGTMVEEQYVFTFPQDWVATFWANVENHIFSAWQDRNNWRLGIFPVALPAAGAKYEVFYDTTLNAWSA